MSVTAFYSARALLKRRETELSNLCGLLKSELWKTEPAALCVFTASPVHGKGSEGKIEETEKSNEPNDNRKIDQRKMTMEMQM